LKGKIAQDPLATISFLCIKFKQNKLYAIIESHYFFICSALRPLKITTITPITGLNNNEIINISS
jgi:hypothetical protein